MDCPNIDNLSLSERSKDTIETIRSIREAANVLATALSAGAMYEMFAGSQFIEASVNVTTYDFEEFAKTMKGVPAIARRRVEQEAMRTFLDVRNYQEKQFWRAIYEGCSVH